MKTRSFTLLNACMLDVSLWCHEHEIPVMIQVLDGFSGLRYTGGEVIRRDKKGRMVLWSPLNIMLVVRNQDYELVRLRF